MIQPITEERWQQAQKAEREFHDKRTLEEKINEYGSFYATTMCLLEMQDLQISDALEVGCADIPALYFQDAPDCAICEPMPSPDLDEICASRDIVLYRCKFEDMDDELRFSEIWLFNVMQHVQDPEKFIAKAKRIGRTIRFFEPIDWPIEMYHPFSYTIDDYKRWFGDCVQFYKGGSIKGFHEANCAYGVWRAEA